MKGFPNQVSDLTKLKAAITIAAELEAAGKSVRDDGVYGEALIRGGVAGTGHAKQPIEEYLDDQRSKPLSYQSYRTTARGLRELFRVLGFMDDLAALTAAGAAIAAIKSSSLSGELLRLWRTSILEMRHHGNYGGTSHPYQVLLRLIANVPGITRANCALALEAKDDSEDELDRIVKLAKLDEDKIVEKLGVSRTNWDNAKKVLPSFAEQLGDARKIGHSLYLNDPLTTTKTTQPKESTSTASVAPAGSRREASKVKAADIAKAGTVETFDEVPEAAVVATPEEVAASKEKLADRLKRHNLIVQKVAALLEAHGAELFENPFDCLARFEDTCLLLEVKTLDRSAEDEISRVREALAQLLYYEAFVAGKYSDKRQVMKLAVFEFPITHAHGEWLRASNIEAIIVDGEEYLASAAAIPRLKPHFGGAIKAS